MKNNTFLQLFVNPKNGKTTFYVTDIYNERDVTYLALMLTDTDFRKLMPNEGYYRMYDDPKYQGTSDIDLDAIDYDDWSDDDEDDQTTWTTEYNFIQ